MSKFKCLLIIYLCLISESFITAQNNSVILFPADKSANVNPDTHLELTFPSAPVLGTTGKIRIYDASNNRLVDMLDLSIPAGYTLTLCNKYSGSNLHG
jgi:hypothetical protein